MKPIDIIDEVRDSRDQERGLDQIEGLMLHRCGVDLRTGTVLGYTAKDVSAAFTGKNPQFRESVAKVTGHQNPYTFMVNAGVGPFYLNGIVWQCLPLDELGWHARRWSRKMVGCAWIGDPRVQKVSEQGWKSMVSLCAGLCRVLGLDPLSGIHGHGEIQGGEKAPGSPGSCPGLSVRKLDEFREDVQLMLEAGDVSLDVILTKE